MEQVQLALRDQICQLGVSPDITADVLGALAARDRAFARWGLQTRIRVPARQSYELASTGPIALRDVSRLVAPFCHDVLLYRAFIGPAYQDSAREWLGPQMWHVVEALGGWRRVHDLPLSRMSDEAAAAREQSASFLRPPAYRLAALEMSDLWDLIRPWARKYAPLSRLNASILARKKMTAGAWLWVLDRTDADMRRRGGGPDRDLPHRATRLADRVEAAVGLEIERS